MMLLIVLLCLPGVLSTDGWKVTNPETICGVRGSNVTIPCNYTYPNDNQVTQVSWCQNVGNTAKCDQVGPYVYNSLNQDNQVNFQYTGNNISDCSLLISNINSTNSGVYLFRFITNSTEGRFTSDPGTNIKVTDLNISMTRLRDNGSITVGDSLNFTCKPVSCPGYLLELQWLKNNNPTAYSGPILTFTSVTPEDSGNYSCALKHFISSASQQISLYVEEKVFTGHCWSTAVFTGVCCVSIIFILAFLTVINRIADTQQTPEEEGEHKAGQNRATK